MRSTNITKVAPSATEKGWTWSCMGKEKQVYKYGQLSVIFLIIATDKTPLAYVEALRSKKPKDSKKNILQENRHSKEEKFQLYIKRRENYLPGKFQSPSVENTQDETCMTQIYYHCNAVHECTFHLS